MTKDTLADHLHTILEIPDSGNKNYDFDFSMLHCRIVMGWRFLFLVVMSLKYKCGFAYLVPETLSLNDRTNLRFCILAFGDRLIFLTIFRVFTFINASSSSFCFGKIIRFASWIINIQDFDNKIALLLMIRSVLIYYHKHTVWQCMLYIRFNLVLLCVLHYRH